MQHCTAPDRVTSDARGNELSAEKQSADLQANPAFKQKKSSGWHYK